MSLLPSGEEALPPPPPPPPLPPLPPPPPLLELGELGFPPLEKGGDGGFIDVVSDESIALASMFNISKGLINSAAEAGIDAK